MMNHRDCHICSQIKYRISMLRSSLCDYSDAYILVKRTVTVLNTGTAATLIIETKKVIFKNCTPITDCISETNGTEQRSS